MTNSIDHPDASLLRTRSRRWCTLWPGSGFGILGYPGLAAICCLVLIVWMASILYFSFALTPTSVWVMIGLGLFSVLAWGIEYLAVGRLAVKDADQFLRRYYWLFAVVGYLIMTALVIFVLTRVGVVSVGSTGMAPTLERDERVLYRKTPGAALAARQLVIFRGGEAWGKDHMLISRVLAVPGQRLSIKEGQYWVNDQPAHSVGPQERRNH